MSSSCKWSTAQRFIMTFTLSLLACQSKHEPEAMTLKMNEDKIIVSDQSPFLKHLEIISIGTYESRQVQFQSVGKMIALANPSNELTGPQTTWTELDPKISRAAKLSLTPEAQGTAYGMTSVSSELSQQLATGQALNLRHYRVTENGWRATIFKLLPNVDKTSVDVIFRVTNAKDLYPGTNCEVSFPLLHAKAIKIPAVALVHSGLDEYVFEETSPREFTPHKVTPVQGSADEIILSSGVSENAKIVGRGAILLKPKIRTSTGDEAGETHVN